MPDAEKDEFILSIVYIDFLEFCGSTKIRGKEKLLGII